MEQTLIQYILAENNLNNKEFEYWLWAALLDTIQIPNVPFVFWRKI